MPARKKTPRTRSSSSRRSAAPTSGATRTARPRPPGTTRRSATARPHPPGTARRSGLARPAGPARPADLSAITGMSDDAVRAKTGMTWGERFEILDGAGAAAMTHTAIARYAHEALGLSGWWSQMVTVGYERARGLRQKHQMPDGYQVSRSKTVNAPLSRLFAAWADPATRRRWLPESALEIRTATRDKSMRITWGRDATHVDAMFLRKDAGKSQVSVQHRKLPDAKAAERMQAYWGERLERLKDLLEA